MRGLGKSSILEVMKSEPVDSFIDYYQLLGVQPDAGDAVVRKAFMSLAKEQHPDMGGSLEDMRLLNVAYATLRSTKSRKAYDMLHQFHTGALATAYRDTHDDTFSPSSLDGLTDADIDNFINSVFNEYVTKPSKEPLHKKAASALRFRRKK